MENSVINYSPSCRSKPVNLRSSSEHKWRYLWWNGTIMFKTQKGSKDINACRSLTQKRRNCWIKSLFLFSLGTNNYSRFFITLRLNHWCHMDYFINVLTTFLGLECVSCFAVYTGSEISRISLKIVICDLKINEVHFWVNYPFKSRHCFQLPRQSSSSCHCPVALTWDLKSCDYSEPKHRSEDWNTFFSLKWESRKHFRERIAGGLKWGFVGVLLKMSSVWLWWI